MSTCSRPLGFAFRGRNHEPKQVGASLGCLEVDDARRGEFVGKRVTFEGIVSDPALDGGVAACAIGDTQETRTNSAFSVPRAKEAAYAGKAGKKAASVGVHVISGRSGGGTKERVAKPSDRAGEANATTAVATETKQGQDFATAAGADETTKGLSSMKARVCASGYPRGTGTGTGEDADNLSSSSVDTSSLFVWPGGLEPTAEVPGLRAQIPCRLTCVRITPFETRFGEARNALLAGTAAGMVVSFDWGCLVRDAGKMEGSVVKKGKGPYDAAGRQRDQKECSVLPSAQVGRCAWPRHRSSIEWGDSVKIVVEQCDMALLVQRMLKRDIWAFEACSFGGVGHVI